MNSKVYCKCYIQEYFLSIRHHLYSLDSFTLQGNDQLVKRTSKRNHSWRKVAVMILKIYCSLPMWIKQTKAYKNILIYVVTFVVNLLHVSDISVAIFREAFFSKDMSRQPP